MLPDTFFSTTSLITIGVTGLASSFMVGCQTSPQSIATAQVEQAAAIAPADWSAASRQPVTDPAQLGNVRETTKSAHQWTRYFNDASLQALVEEALLHNLDLKVAAARMESSRQLMRIARADLFPSLGLEAGASYSEISAPGMSNVKYEDYSVAIGAAWELDLWGKVRSSSAASEAEFEAAGFDLIQARHSIVAAVCSAWYQCVAASEQLQLAEATVESYSSTAELIRNRFESGIDTALDYRLAVANAESAKSALASRKESFSRSVRALQVILGRYPDTEMVLLESLPELESAIPADIPLTVLERRPDVQAAEKRVASAAYSAKSAARAKLPSVNITGAAGLQSDEFSSLLDGNDDFWSVGLSLSQPLFSGGRIDANQKRAEALLTQYQAIFQQVALNAFFEVEQALDADVFFAELETSAKAAREQSVEAEKLAWDQYTSGIINIVTVLESQRYALNAKQSAIEARNARLQNRIQLFLALGGDV